MTYIYGSCTKNNSAHVYCCFDFCMQIFWPVACKISVCKHESKRKNNNTSWENAKMLKLRERVKTVSVLETLRGFLWFLFSFRAYILIFLPGDTFSEQFLLKCIKYSWETFYYTLKIIILFAVYLIND